MGVAVLDDEVRQRYDSLFCATIGGCFECVDNNLDAQGHIVDCLATRDLRVYTALILYHAHFESVV
jgi:hypothetical protein